MVLEPRKKPSVAEVRCPVLSMPSITHLQKSPDFSDVSVSAVTY